MLSRAGLWSVRHLRFARCLGPIGLHLDYDSVSLSTQSVSTGDATPRRLFWGARRDGHSPSN